MASQAARAARNLEARRRLERNLETLARRLGVKLPPRPDRRMRDPGLEPIIQIEWFADVIEAVDDTVEQLAISDQAPEGYEALTMPMLRQEIENRGIDGKGTKKADLIAILEADDEQKARALESSDESTSDDGESDDQSERTDSNTSNGDLLVSERGRETDPLMEELEAQRQEEIELQRDLYNEMSYGELQIESSKAELTFAEEPTREQMIEALTNKFAETV